MDESAGQQRSFPARRLVHLRTVCLCTTAAAIRSRSLATGGSMGNRGRSDRVQGSRDPCFNAADLLGAGETGRHYEHSMTNRQRNCSLEVTL